jgi:hypothetical protein
VRTITLAEVWPSGLGDAKRYRFQLLTDRLLTLHALLKGFGLIPLPDTRIG